jgi:predicted nucleic acid-binding protein
MPLNTFDTRFFIEHYYSKDPKIHKITKEIITHSQEKCISAIVISEIYKLTLEKDGREIARLRATLLAKDFEVANVDTEIAIASAELRHRYKIPLADSLIAATSVKLGAVCYTDDPHLSSIREIKTRWF